MPRLPVGMQYFRDDDLDADEVTVNAGPCTIYGWDIYHDNTGAVFVQLYDALIADVTVGTTTPDLTLGIGANLHNRLSLPGGITFNIGCVAVCVTEPETSASTGPGLNDCIFNIFFLNTSRRSGA